MYETQTEFLKAEYPWIYRDLSERLSDEGINTASRRQLLDEYLKWHGIVGYTDDIIIMMEVLFANDESNQLYYQLAECDFDCKLDGSFE